MNTLNIVPGETLLVPKKLPVKNEGGQADLNGNGPFLAEHLFCDDDRPDVFLVNLRGQLGSFKADAFRKVASKETINADKIVLAAA